MRIAPAATVLLLTPPGVAAGPAQDSVRPPAATAEAAPPSPAPTSPPAVPAAERKEGADAKGPAEVPPLEWFTYLGTALRKAVARKAQILVVFGAEWCPWCRRLEEQTLKEATLRPFLEPRVLVRVDIDKSPEVARAMGVISVPEIGLFNADGFPLARWNGYLAANDLKAWIVTAAEQNPMIGAVSLRALRPDAGLDRFFELEAAGKLPDQAGWEALLATSAGPQGETRMEALRLVRTWSPALAPGLEKALASPRLKVRLSAWEALSEMGAPVKALDPWSGPAADTERIAAWAAERAAAVGKPSPAAPDAADAAARATSPALSVALDADLAVLEGSDAARHETARERLVAAGPAMVPRLRDRSRSLRAVAPAAAARLDEVRFRILLPHAVVRRLPDAASRLAAGAPGPRSQAMEEVVKAGSTGLGPLLREALCDPDPLFRETAVASARAVLGKGAVDALEGLLKDPEPNVRAVTLRELARAGTPVAAKSIDGYLASERDPDMVGHAVRALQEVRSKTTRTVLRSLLMSPHWSVRAAAAKALMEIDDKASLPNLLPLLEDPDAFVVGQALEAIGKLGANLQGSAAEPVVDAVAGIVERRPELIRSALKTLSHSAFRKVRKADTVLRTFVKHADPAIRADALEALAEDRERPAFEEVRAGLEDPAAVVRSAAARGLRELIEDKVLNAMLARGEKPPAYADCRPRLLAGMKDPDPDVSLECALALLYFGDVAEGAPVWRRFFEDRDDGRRGRAIRGLRWLPDPAVREAVFARWAASSKEHQELMLVQFAYGEHRADAKGFLFDLLPRVPPDLRGTWVNALLRGELGDELYNPKPGTAKKYTDMIGRLRKAAEAATTPDRLFLRVLAAAYDPEPIEEDLRAALKDPEAILRRTALAALLRKRVKLVAQDLAPLVRDPVPEVRALALVGCMPEAFRGEFDDLRHEWLGAESSYHLGNFPGEYSSFSLSPTRVVNVVQLPEDLLNARLGDVDPRVRVRAAFLMTMEGSEEALEVLARAWREDSNHDNRRRLIRAVVWCWEDRYAELLEEIYDTFEENDSWQVREFYQAIKPLKGEKVGALRVKVRREYGNLSW